MRDFVTAPDYIPEDLEATYGQAARRHVAHRPPPARHRPIPVAAPTTSGSTRSASARQATYAVAALLGFLGVFALSGVWGWLAVSLGDPIWVWLFAGGAALTVLSALGLARLVSLAVTPVAGVPAEETVRRPAGAG